MLKLLVKSAHNLINVDFGPNNLSDPYVSATFRGEKKKTNYIKDNLNPVWTSEHNNELEWDVGVDPIKTSDEILIQVKDYEKILRRKLLGQVTIPLIDLLKTKDYTIEQTYNLVDSYNRPIVATLSLRLQYIPSQKVLDYMADEVDAGELNQEDEERLEEEEEVRDEKGNVVRIKRKRGHLHEHRREWTTKKKHFKITIKIHEGRQLPGINISPIARVTVKNIKQETRVKKSTNKPDFNQTFTFNFHCSEAELFDELIILEVFNSKMLFGKSTLGFFETEIGAIYEFPDHSVVRKWVLLTGVGIQDDEDDEDRSTLSKLLRRRGRDGGCAGYLKVTMTVLGSGDEPPLLSQLEAAGDDEDDVDANCLMPSGVTREPAEFHVKVYLAQDLPQMDAGYISTIRKLFLPGKSREDPNEKKKQVDPFFVFSFSGKKVETKTIYGQNNPNYNQLLKLPILYPTMCERIKLELYDKDKGNQNDTIATSFLALSEISGNEHSSSFLPHFGPCFVNFYGSPREFSIFTRDNFVKLNKGFGEGVAYRGRVLMEMTQERSAGKTGPSSYNIYNEDIVRVQAYLRQEKFKLFACFKNASMISKTDKPIEFEVSIGNFGNAMDETEISCNTPPTNPIYDGCHYHYLPWHHYKPCICLDCHWEDISFRIGPLNIINRLYEIMESQVSEAKSLVIANHKDGIESVRKCLEQFINKCREARERLKPSKTTPPVNTLDLRLAKLRQDEFKFIEEEAKTWDDKIISGQEFDIKHIIEDMQDYLSRLRSLAFEPQLSIPDVIIWMICGGDRIAYHRVPIQDVMFSTNKDARGKYCGKTIELLLKYPGESNRGKEDREVPAMVRVELWVGLRKHQMDWIRREGQSEGRFKIYAETYENEMKTPIVGWTTPLPTFRSHFSNASGDVPLTMKNFHLQKGWRFSGEEKAVLDKSLMYDPDWGHTVYTEEVYEHQSRNLLGGTWSQESRWTEEDGQDCRSIEDFPVRLGWRWESDWRVDTDRAVDASGWEYCLYEGCGIYTNASKATHMSRRRRWVRTRIRDENVMEKQSDVTEKRHKFHDDWEYATTFQSKFHVSKRSRDLVRRKRLLKEIVLDERTEITELPPKLFINLNPKKEKADKSKSKDKHQGKGETSEDESQMREGYLPVLPRMYIVYENPHRFQLWVYIYQGRDLLAMDDTGQSDPYVRVAFCNQSQRTEWIPQTLCPKWDQTLVFPSIELFDTVENIARDPPNIIMEVFDRDPVGKHDFIGRCTLQPVVRTKEGSSSSSLTWITLHNRQANAGQVLTAAELFLDEGIRLPSLPSPRPSSYSRHIYPVRDGIRPQLQLVAVEILCWGVRNMENYHYRSVDRPCVEFEWGGRKISSEALQSLKKNPNFSLPILEREILHLEMDPFTPAMSIKVYDTRNFNQKPLVGMTTISSLEMLHLQPYQQTADLEEPASPKSPALLQHSKREIPEHNKDKEKFDWWSKYYYSIRANTTQRQRKKYPELDSERTSDHLQIYSERKFGQIEIFDKELEKVERFEGLNDFVTSFKLHRGKWKGEDHEDDDIVGELKANIRVYSVETNDKAKLPPGMFENLDEMKIKWPLKCVVRVYVIRAFDLQPCDPTTGLADPYLVVSLGGKKQDSKKDCHKNTLDPIFGQMFEFNASVPIAKDLKIKVVDSDADFDDDIGETVIDLEQRLLTRLHASCGLSTLYYVGGPYEWRDSKRPKDILRDYCHANGYKMSFYPKGPSPSNLILESRTRYLSHKSHEFSVSEIENYDGNRPYMGSVDQQLSLHALHRLGLVPEHIETRPLYSSLQPGIEQGKLQLWVDIFPKTGNVDIKPAVDITPRKAEPYVLRVIIWDTTEVELQETSIANERMSDIYVKCWIDGINEKQRTDTHYRSLDGDGNFNWRMCFPLMIMPIDKQLVISKKEKFYNLDKTTQQIVPKLKIQIWEDDILPGTDDFLGTRTLYLNDLVRPCRSPSQCGYKNNPEFRRKRPDDFVDLFSDSAKSRSIRGWYTCWKREDDPPTKQNLGGKVDMSIELLTEEEANKYKVGLGRDEPNQYPHLPEPNRPKTSFLWFVSPFKTMRYIVWRNYKWYIIGLIITVLLVLLIVFFVYNIPGYSVKKLFNA